MLPNDLVVKTVKLKSSEEATFSLTQVSCVGLFTKRYVPGENGRKEWEERICEERERERDDACSLSFEENSQEESRCKKFA